MTAHGASSGDALEVHSMTAHGASSGDALEVHSMTAHGASSSDAREVVDSARGGGQGGGGGGQHCHEHGGTPHGAQKNAGRHNWR